MSDVLTVGDGSSPNVSPDQSFVGLWLQNWLNSSSSPTVPDMVAAAGAFASYGFARAAAYGLSEAEAAAAGKLYQPSDVAMNVAAGLPGVGAGAQDAGTFGFLRDMSALTGSWAAATVAAPTLEEMAGVAVGIFGLPEEVAVGVAAVLVVAAGYEASRPEGEVQFS
ncbi:hypothetical protein [Sulfuriferula nivalis]|uniref:Uncharacterized protein n=1 Tax=Sulfuriferula nivalis TaxID=2675298 RepID=A0A809S8Y6_9PROT|nr:hypothetical protein [Sulfuriferula nivalis]BBP00542.1 hypothetical protein SFSGTM_12500 [Sulfuriferula nivalis]